MAILPTPRRFEVSHTVVSAVDAGVSVFDGGDGKLLADALPGAAAIWAEAYGLRLTAGASSTEASIVIRSGPGEHRAEGVDPRPSPRAGLDEGYAISHEAGRLVLEVASAEGVFRGLISIGSAISQNGSLPAISASDRPRFAWRGLSLDVVRHWYRIDEIEKIIDLLAVLKLNVLHLHLSDMEAWRMPVPGYPALAAAPERYDRDDLTRLVAYARARFVTVVPEFDMPGHVAAAVRAVPELGGVEYPSEMLAYLVWSNPAVPTFLRAVLSEATEIFDAPYFHIGGDEAFGMPEEEYAEFIHAAAALVRRFGRLPIGWQETSRSPGLGAGGLTQLWVAERDRFDPVAAREQWGEGAAAFIAMMEPVAALSVSDAERIGEHGSSVILSSSDPLYLDRKPAEATLEAGQAENSSRLGHPSYPPTPSTSVLAWEPTSDPQIIEHSLVIGGIEAAIWAESIESMDDLAHLILPRLAFVAERAWASPDADTSQTLRATRASSPSWERLGFLNHYRSVDLWGARYRSARRSEG